MGLITRRQALTALSALAVAGCGTVNAAVRPASSSKPPGGLLWQTRVPGGLVDLEMAGGQLCAATASGIVAYRPGNGIFAAAGQSAIQALDAVSGRTVWTFTVPYPQSLWNIKDLSYAAGHLYTFGPVTRGHTLATVLIALDSGTGRQAWQAELPWSTGVAYAFAANGIVYVAGLTRLTALDATTGRHRWTVSGPAMPVAAGVAGGAVYGFTSDSSALAVADAATGAPLWHASLDNESAIAASDTAIFASVRSVHPDIPAPGEVLALDPRTGRTVWQRHFPQGAPSILTATSTVLYAGQEDGTLHALSASTGQELWHYSTAEFANDGLAYLLATASNVYAADINGALCALQA
jgi:outer membrane protein assembly factor BamB